MDSALVLLRRARETFLTAIEARRQGLEGLTLTLTYLYLFVFGLATLSVLYPVYHLHFPS